MSENCIIAIDFISISLRETRISKFNGTSTEPEAARSLRSVRVTATGDAGWAHLRIKKDLGEILDPFYTK